MAKKATTKNQLLLEREDLRLRLDEAQKNLQAIRSGEADALIVSGECGEQLFTLKGADHSYRILIEDMYEGALTLTMEGLILYANRRFADILKTPLEKVIGSTIQTWIAPDHQLALQSILKQGVIDKYREQSVLTTSDGTKVPVFLSVSKLSNSELPYSFCIVATDLTEQKRADAIEASEKMTRELLAVSNQSRLALLSVIEDQKLAEEKIKNSLIEKEVLLKEVHHRVKNNLMIIIGLIKMQETKADNEMFTSLLQELEGRINAMAQVHEVLHKSTDLGQIDLQNYIEMLIDHIRAQFGSERGIHFRVQAAGVDVNLDVAIPCGLILNELITNAYKHAFPGGKPRAGENKCEIKVSADQEDDVLTLTIANNGGELTADFDLEKSETLGLRLVKMLSQQLNGFLELDRSAGTSFCLKIPLAGK
jgi:PAS domain S-box-containing protein